MDTISYSYNFTFYFAFRVCGLSIFFNYLLGR